VPLAAVGKDYFTCAAGPSQGTCSNKRNMRRPDRKTLILDGRKDRLMAPELVKEFIAEFHQEVNRLNRSRGVDLDLQRRELEVVKLRGPRGCRQGYTPPVRDLAITT
jgi:site-specific DNA recombinase